MKAQFGKDTIHAPFNQHCENWRHISCLVSGSEPANPARICIPCPRNQKKKWHHWYIQEKFSQKPEWRTDSLTLILSLSWFFFFKKFLKLQEVLKKWKGGKLKKNYIHLKTQNNKSIIHTMLLFDFICCSGLTTGRQK